MPAVAGKDWFPGQIKGALSHDEYRRIENGSWRDVRDLDLQALIKIIRGWKSRLGKEGRFTSDRHSHILDMLNVRNRYVGHASTRQPDPTDVADDLKVVEDFSALLDLRDLSKDASVLRHAVWKNIIGREGEVRPTPPPQARPTNEFCARPSVTLEECFGDAKLTPSQREAAGKVEEFLFSDDQCFILKGYAGTGKTFFIGGLVRYLQNHCRRSAVIAPTGRAAHVLSERLGIDAGTIHRAIYSLREIKEYREEGHDGVITHKFYFALKANEIAQDAVFIVDEASMVSDNYSEQELLRFGSGRLLRDFIEFVGFDPNDSTKKVIFVGDDAQLPPVEMNLSPALDPQWLWCECRVRSRVAMLTDVKRQASASGILHNAGMIRDIIRSRRFTGFEFDSTFGDTTELRPSEFIDEYLKADTGSDDSGAIVVAYENALVDRYNADIRGRLHRTEQSLVPGDRIIVTRNNFAFRCPLFNGQRGVVRWAAQQLVERDVPVNTGIKDKGQRRTVFVKLRFREAELAFTTGTGHEVAVDVLLLDNLLEHDPRAYTRGASHKACDTGLLHKAMYVDFTKRHPHLRHSTPAFLEELRRDHYFNALQVRYGYAVTCHKAQGGEWDHVFVDGEGMNRFKLDGLRWHYTAFTRARKHLYVCGILSKNILAPTKAHPSPENTRSKPESLDSVVTPAGTILRKVEQKLSGDQVAITKEQRYLTQIRVRSGRHRALVNVHANGKGCISSVRICKTTSEELAARIRDAVSELVGVIIDGGHTGDYDMMKSATHDDHPEFSDALEQACLGAGIAIIGHKTNTPYHTVYSFRRGRKRCSIDAYFDKNATFTKWGNIRGDTDLGGEVTSLRA